MWRSWSTGGPWRGRYVDHEPGVAGCISTTRSGARLGSLHISRLVGEGHEAVNERSLSVHVAVQGAVEEVQWRTAQDVVQIKQGQAPFKQCVKFEDLDLLSPEENEVSRSNSFWVKSKAVLVSHEPSAGRPASGYSWTAQHVEGSGRSSCSFVRRLIVQAAAGCPRLEFPGARLKKDLPARELMSLFDMVRVPAEPPQRWLDFRGACFRPDVVVWNPVVMISSVPVIRTSISQRPH
jgi:hypothetical protein